MGDVTRQTRTGNHSVTSDGTAGALESPRGLLDVVYVVRQGSTNESLRYSLRSLVNLPHHKVYISGGVTPFLKDVNIVQKDVGAMELPDQEDSNLNLYLACQDPQLTEDFIFMNDDFFILKPITELPVMHQGSLDERIKAYKSEHRFHQAYSLIKTKQELLSRGYGPELFSYELHLPMIFNKRKLLDMFRSWNHELFALRPRTMYSNMYKLNGVNTSDAKDATNPEVYLSSGADFDISLAGDRVRNQFRSQGTYESSTITG